MRRENAGVTEGGEGELADAGWVGNADATGWWPAAGSVPGMLLVQLDAKALELGDGATVSMGRIEWGGRAQVAEEPDAQFKFDGDDHFDQAELKSSGEGDLIIAAVLKPDQTDGYHNVIDDDDANRPMIWIDNRDPQSYEANFGVGGDGPHLPPTNSGSGWLGHHHIGFQEWDDLLQQWSGDAHGASGSVGTGVGI